jgi:flagellar motor switch protein FliM
MSDEPEQQQSDEELAAAWGAETEAAEDGTPAQPARVLNQAEIDSLLGFDDGPAGGENRTGMQKIISSGLVSYERLPMLEIVFDRLVRIMSTSLRNFTSDNVEVGIDNILSLRFGDYLNCLSCGSAGRSSMHERPRWVHASPPSSTISTCRSCCRWSIA